MKLSPSAALDTFAACVEEKEDVWGLRRRLEEEEEEEGTGTVGGIHKGCRCSLVTDVIGVQQERRRGGFVEKDFR
jgi:hypothetical protein